MSPRYYGKTSVPKPPQDIWDELADAGKAGDETRINLARARYKAWLEDEGYLHPEGRPGRADEAAR